MSQELSYSDLVPAARYPWFITYLVAAVLDRRDPCRSVTKWEHRWSRGKNCAESDDFWWATGEQQPKPRFRHGM